MVFVNDLRLAGDLPRYISESVKIGPNLVDIKEFHVFNSSNTRVMRNIAMRRSIRRLSGGN